MINRMKATINATQVTIGRMKVATRTPTVMNVATSRLTAMKARSKCNTNCRSTIKVIVQKWSTAHRINDKGNRTKKISEEIIKQQTRNNHSLEARTSTLLDRLQQDSVIETGVR
jgi:hypothetical protein